MRIAPGADGVSIWSSEIFGGAEASRVYEFLSRTFAVKEVETVELRRATHFGRIGYGAVSNPGQIWKKLSRALSAPSEAPPSSETDTEPLRRTDAELLYLDGSSAAPVHVTRIGGSLSTWRVRRQNENTLQLWHPVLRNRRDVVFRLEEELAAILGVEGFRASALTARVTIHFDNAALTVEQLVRQLEKAWPRLLAGLDGPPSRKRLVAAGGLLGLAFTGQYLVPALRPIAVAGVALYSSPNVVKAAKELRRGEVGLYALYSTGLAFLLISGLPFASTAITVLVQSWPHLTRQKVVSSQRRLFGRQRRRPVWARKPNGEGVDTEVDVDDLRKDDVIVVRSGEIVPVDGVVQEGSAAVVEGVLFSADHVEHRSQGDAIGAGAFVCDGSLTIRVERTGAQTSANYIASLLPHTAHATTLALVEAERIANRNAKPALALSALTLAITRTLQPAQVVIRPDYATAPRVSAQLSALHGLARGSQEGAFFRNPAALDRLARADIFVIDESAGLGRRQIEAATVQTVNGVSEGLIAAYATAAYGNARTDRSLALARLASNLEAAPAEAPSVHHSAGVTRYRDSFGSAIGIATAQYVAALNIDVPKRFHTALALHTKEAGRRTETDSRDEPSLRPLWVLRDGKIIGVVSFARNGELIGKQVVAALKAQNRRARFIYLSRAAEAETQVFARGLGIEFSCGGLGQAAKTRLIRDIGRNTVWVGDGADPASRAAIEASTVSVSVAPFWRSPQDFADILLPQKGVAALPALIEIGRAHERRLARDYRTVYAVNLLGLGGAFFARFSSLQAGLLSNLGTGLVYARHARALDRLASAAESEGGRLKRSALR
jgi:manganese/zinc-transporting P-type ATPase C